MPSDAQILENVQQAFGNCARPEHFTSYLHCCECAEHDEVLRSRDLATLTLEDVGNPGWDPICFISPQGFAYYFPALARLALDPPRHPWGWYGPQLMFHLSLTGPRNERVLGCTKEQRRAVVDLLHHLLETRAELADQYRLCEEFFSAIDCWSED